MLSLRWILSFAFVLSLVPSFASADEPSLAEWTQVKATAAETGRDMVSVLADLTRLRSHRRS